MKERGVAIGIIILRVSNFTARDNAIRFAFLLVPILAVGGVALYWLLQFRRRRARRAYMQVLAQQMGFSFNPKMPIPPVIADYKTFSDWKSDFPNILNVIQGSVDGLGVLIFDYRQCASPPSSYQTGKSNPHTNTFAETLVCIQSTNHTPFLDNHHREVDVKNIRSALDDTLKGFYQKHPELRPQI